MATQDHHLKHVHMGLGSAMRRFMQLEWQVRQGFANPSDAAEREMLLTALDAIPLDIGFDCNVDGVPDTVDIFQKSAASSCCRLLPLDEKGSGEEPQVEISSEVKPRSVSSSRLFSPSVPVATPDGTEEALTDPKKTKKKRGLFNGFFGGGDE